MRRGVFCLILIILSSLMAAASWDTYQHNDEHNGLLEFNGSDSLQLRCATAPLNHYLTSSSPIVDADGTIYVGTFSRKLYALNPDCSIKWVFDDAGATNDALPTPVIGDDGTIYVSNGPRMFAVNADGSKRWVYEPEFDFSFSFKGDLLYREGVIWSGGTYTLVGINEDGSEHCRFSSPDRTVISVPTYSNGYIYVSDTHNVYKVDQECNAVWTYEGDRFYQSVPVVAGGRVYVSDFQSVVILDAENGQRVGDAEIGAGGFEAERAPLLVVGPERIYSVSKQKLAVFSMTGELQCEVPGDFLAAPVVDALGRIYLGDKVGTVSILDENCAVLDQYAVGGAIEKAVAFGNEKELLVPSRDKKIYIFEGVVSEEAAEQTVLEAEEPTGIIVTQDQEVNKEREICRACLYIGKKTGEEWRNCAGGFQDVEGCYLADYYCDDPEQVEIGKVVCNSCEEGVCDGQVDQGDQVDLPGVTDVPIAEFNLPTCQSCYVERASGGNRKVDECQGGARDREFCYQAEFTPCEAEQPSTQELCEGVCRDGACFMEKTGFLGKILSWLKNLFS